MFYNVAAARYNIVIILWVPDHNSSVYYNFALSFAAVKCEKRVDSFVLCLRLNFVFQHAGLSHNACNTHIDDSTGNFLNHGYHQATSTGKFRSIHVIILLSFYCTLSISHTNSLSQSCSLYSHTRFHFMTCEWRYLCNLCNVRHDRCRSFDVFGRIVRRQQPSGFPGRHDRPHGRFLGRTPKHDRKR